MNLKDKIVFVDYEGTLSENPLGTGENGVVTFADLLFGDAFSNCKPIEEVKEFLSTSNWKNVYVVGIVDTNVEVEQKEKWLKKHYPSIMKQNLFFVSNNHKKIEVINEIISRLGLSKSEVLFIDDKEKHLAPAKEEGFLCLSVAEIVAESQNSK